MNTALKVIGYFKTSVGNIMVIKLPDADLCINLNTILSNKAGSKWRIEGIGMGGKPDLEHLSEYDPLVKNFRVKLVSGEDIVEEEDILYL